MSPYRKKQEPLPGWLWFFLILPITLVVALLYRRRQLPALMEQARRLREERLPRPFKRYSEPDSIPLRMEDEYAAREAELSASEAELSNPGSRASSRAANLIDPAEAVDQSVAADIEQPVKAASQPKTTDDLIIIEGIGKAIDRLLRENGIATFQQLADAPVARLEEILVAAKLRALANPATWPEQARLAAEGRFDELTALQATLKGGRRAG